MNGNKNRPVLLSGIQPTGTLTIGNYIGAVRHWKTLQETHDCLFMLADLHALTVSQQREALHRRCLEFTALYAACGLDPEKQTFFIQSHVTGHTQLLWILNCIAHMGELYRMTQFKDKSERHTDPVNVGLFDYPVLMAADILLYGTDLVPVGDDQKQHLEFTRGIARRFNRRYGEILTVPEPYIPVSGSRIMGLQDPSAKMSKTDENHRNYIALLDSPEEIRNKIKQAVTDSGKELRSDPSKPGISNLMTIFASISGLSVESIEERYSGKGYARFKRDLADRVVEFLMPIQERFHTVYSDRPALLSMLRKGAANARNRASGRLDRIYGALGLVR